MLQCIIAHSLNPCGIALLLREALIYRVAPAAALHCGLIEFWERLMASCMRFWMVGAAALAGAMLPAAQAADLLTLGGASYHFERDLDLQEFNYGLGFERDIDDKLSWSAGVYKNSLRRASVYAFANYYPFKLSESWRVGLIAGLSTGYHRSAVIPVAAPTIEWRGDWVAAQFYLVPTIKPYIDGAVVVQFKVVLDK